jgi:hypothetical protein
MLVGLFSSAGHGVQPGMQTEGYEHEHKFYCAPIAIGDKKFTTYDKTTYDEDYF